MLKVCTVDGCTRPLLARGWCSTHYMRWRNHGDVNTVVTARGLTVEERLRRIGWDEILTDESLGVCWNFRGKERTRNGYARIRVGNSKFLVHRLSYETWVGEIPEGLQVRHRCDNKSCMRPGHLETGTNKENSDDYWTRGRHRPRT